MPYLPASQDNSMVNFGISGTNLGLSNRLNHEIEGSGIDQTLVRGIIEVHGGHIWVESEPGPQRSLSLFSMNPVFCVAK